MTVLDTYYIFIVQLIYWNKKLILIANYCIIIVTVIRFVKLIVRNKWVTHCYCSHLHVWCLAVFISQMCLSIIVHCLLFFLKFKSCSLTTWTLFYLTDIMFVTVSFHIVYNVAHSSTHPHARYEWSCHIRRCHQTHYMTAALHKLCDPGCEARLNFGKLYLYRVDVQK
jgi:hypothetical protein